MLSLEVIREPSCVNGTLGKIIASVDGKVVHTFRTLEDPVHTDGKKVWGDTAIPAGTYTVRVRYSNRFKKDLPGIENVPGFEGVLIHGGNTKADTRGCILVGTQLQALSPNPRIGICAPAVEKLTTLVRAHGSATLTIKDAT